MKRKLVVLVVACWGILAGCGSDVSSKDIEEHVESVGQEIADQVGNVVQAENEYVLMVKGGYPSSFPGCKYGDVFDSFFGSPTWKYFEADTGEQVVEFTGYCTYHDAEVKARLQFILDVENDTFEAGAMSFNDVPQTTLITAAMLEKAFEYYMEENGIQVSDGGDLEGEFSDGSLWEPQGSDSAQNEGGKAETETETETETVEGISDVEMEGEESKIPVEYIFPSDWGQVTSWYSATTGYYMIPVMEEGAPIIYFSVENNTISASLAYGVVIDSVEQNEYGGLICTGNMYLYTKSFGSDEEGEANGVVEVAWTSMESIDFPQIRMVDGNQMTDTSMIASDYGYYGPIE